MNIDIEAASAQEIDQMLKVDLSIDQMNAVIERTKTLNRIRAKTLFARSAPGKITEEKPEKPGDATTAPQQEPLGKKFGLWEITGQAYRVSCGARGQRHTVVPVRCACGLRVVRQLLSLRRGKSKSCRDCMPTKRGRAKAQTASCGSEQ